MFSEWDLSIRLKKRTIIDSIRLKKCINAYIIRYKKCNFAREEKELYYA
jgi:hypothetical protein